MDNLGSLLGDSSRMLRRAFDERVRDLGVTRPQWQVLTVLKRHPGITQAALADHLEVEPITVCRMVDRLQEAGLVERRADPADRRRWSLFLTEPAKALGDTLRPIAQGLFDEAMEGIDTADRAALLAMLERIRDNLSRRPAEGLVAHG